MAVITTEVATDATTASDCIYRQLAAQIST